MSSSKRAVEPPERLVEQSQKKKKRLVFRMSKEIYSLAQRMTAEKKDNFSGIKPPAESETIPQETAQPLNPGPSRIVTHHDKITAALCINIKGFTLYNGVISITELERVNNAHLAEAMHGMKIKQLRCYDDKTYKKVIDIKNSYPEMFENLHVLPVESFPINRCHFCHDENCHRWQATALLAKFHNLHFNPVKH